MGYDLHGRNYGNLDGSYFSFKGGMWEPIWNYVCLVAGEILTDEQKKTGFFNDGAYIDEIQCEKLANLLDEEINSGRTKQYEIEIKEYLARLDDMPCDECAGSGSDECPSCGGTGKVRPDASDWQFYENNIKKFKVFLENCGGFSIW